MTNDPKFRERGILVLLCAILVCYPLRHIFIGVNLTDGAYSLGNYLYPEKLDPMWFFSTYLANLLGTCLVRLPGGDTLMGANAYCSLVLSVTALVCFLFAVKQLKGNMYVVFAAEILALSLCWAPNTILYHYITYGLFDLAAIFVYLGLYKEKDRYLILAGICLGLNLAVRFPNITECALILAVWANGRWMRKRLRDVVKTTFISILGFLLGAGIVFIGIAGTYGVTAYADAVMRLFQMPANASDYSMTAMILGPIQEYIEKAKSFLMLVSIALMVTGLGILTGGIRIGKEKNRRTALILVTAALTLALFRIWKARGFFGFFYYSYSSMYFWAALYLLLAACLFIGFILSRRTEKKRKMLCLMMLLIMAVTPLGGNNRLYSVINNLFLILPVSAVCLTELFTGFTKWDDRRRGLLSGSYMPIRALRIPTAPLQVVVLLTVAAFAFQSALFGVFFTFRDGTEGIKRDTKIEKNAILMGMMTQQDKAKALEDLTSYVESENLTDREVILYGDIPALCFYLHMEPAISTIWPSLRSYTPEVFETEMESLVSDPVVILSPEVREQIFGDRTGEAIEAGQQKKLQILKEYIISNDYHETYGDGMFSVYTRR